MSKRKLFEWGGVIAGVILVAFGAVALFMGVNGRSDVRSSLAAEKIVGTPDMTPALIAKEAKDAKLTNVDLPTCSVANQTIDTGSKARCFASYMRIHALEASGGQTYAQMGRYITAAGKPTNDPNAAQKDPKSGQPVENPVRQVWVTETALSTALNVSYMAERLALFGITVGVALLLTGIGFIVLAFGGALRRRDAALATPARPATGSPVATH